MPKLRNTKQSHSNDLAEEKTSTRTHRHVSSIDVQRNRTKKEQSDTTQCAEEIKKE